MTPTPNEEREREAALLAKEVTGQAVALWKHFGYRKFQDSWTDTKPDHPNPEDATEYRAVPVEVWSRILVALGSARHADAGASDPTLDALFADAPDARDAAAWDDTPPPAVAAPADATHECKVCGALWREWAPGETSPGDAGSWSCVRPGRGRSWATAACGPCCDNVPMGDQLRRIAPTTTPPPESAAVAEARWVPCPACGGSKQARHMVPGLVPCEDQFHALAAQGERKEG